MSSWLMTFGNLLYTGIIMWVQIMMVPVIFKWIDNAPYGDRGAYNGKAVEVIEIIEQEMEKIKEEQAQAED